MLSRLCGRRSLSLQTSFVAQTARRQYNFASPAFVSAISNLPIPDVDTLRKDAIRYCQGFDAQSWHADPVCTVLKGEVLRAGTEVDTTNAFEEKNGKQIVCTEGELQAAMDHIRSYKPPVVDLRDAVRKVEQLMLSKHAGALIGNQAVDFKKQDGVTEIEEAIQANTVERRLNDQLFEDEVAGKVTISRRPAFVGCVSNFSNFLDLSRKTLRNLELGVPVVVLSRSNTTQHMFRWYQLLSQEARDHGIDSGMMTFLSCNVDQARRVFDACNDSPLYFTGSRPIAALIKELLPKTFASTGGPNTMVLPQGLTPATKAATRMSTLIENSGQCTALRHLVVPDIDEATVREIYSEAPMVNSAVESLEKGEFAALFKSAENERGDEGYQTVEQVPVHYKISTSLPKEIDEKWRRAYLDVTKTADLNSDPALDRLARWLVEHQPISLAVNGKENNFAVMRRLFEGTGMCVYTVGDDASPALTAQARPQEGEVFGELPPRKELSQYTRFPVVVPTPTPGYNATYTESYLQKLASAQSALNLDFILPSIESKVARGFLNEVVNYLVSGCGPKRGIGQRTSLFGLQRTPMYGNGRTLIHCKDCCHFDTVAVHLAPFLITNAGDDVSVYCDASNQQLKEKLSQISHKKFRLLSDKPDHSDFYNVVVPGTWTEFPLVGHFVSTLFSFGHIKSTKPEDDEFLKTFTASKKWLSVDASL